MGSGSWRMAWDLSLLMGGDAGSEPVTVDDTTWSLAPPSLPGHAGLLVSWNLLVLCGKLWSVRFSSFSKSTDLDDPDP